MNDRSDAARTPTNDGRPPRKQTPRVPSNVLYDRVIPIAIGLMVLVLVVVIVVVVFGVGRGY